MAKTDKEMVEKYKERVRKQNEVARENWDIVSCKLPKGTKKRIENQGFSINGYIKQVVLADLERLEKSEKINAELEKINEKEEKEAEFDELNEFIKRKQAENERSRAEKSVLLEPSRVNSVGQETQ